MSTEQVSDYYDSLEDKYVLIDFFSERCGPCKKIAPKLDILMVNYDIKLVKIDIEKFPDLADKYKIKSIPTFVLLKRGREKKRIKGADIHKIKELLDEL